MPKVSLPIDAHLEAIWESVSANPIVVVEAPPGSGKTTRVAPYIASRLRDRSDDRRIQLLQPRRLAARSVAQRIASEEACQLGDRVGYQVRFENRTNQQTRIVVSTEGILLRRLQDDPLIEDVAIVLLDEFHERSLDSDLTLGMLRRLQQTMRDDLRIVIMSATIDTSSIERALGPVPIVSVDSRCYPVQIRFRPIPSPKIKPVEHMADTLLDVVPKHDGDVLAFLPGAGEIERTSSLLERSSLARDCDIVKLYGTMPLEEQVRAIEPGARRKIVLATNIAETSLTIEGIRVVVDSGLARVMRFSSDVGLDRLCLENISQASATQRTGRAGRVAPGVCYRLWSEASDRSRAAYLEPEIVRVDLASAALQLYAWGEGRAKDFPWLEPPHPDAWQAAEQLLTHLGAIENLKITELGKHLVRLPIHPRLARVLVESVPLRCQHRACLLAAILSERDPFDRRESRDSRPGMVTRNVNRWDSDCIERLELVEDYLNGRNRSSAFGDLNRSAVSNITSVAKQLSQALRELSFGPVRENDALSERESLMLCLLAGYPDRLARRRGPGKNNGLMVGGKGVTLTPQSGVCEPEFFLCIDVDSGRGDANVRQASGVKSEWVMNSAVEREECFYHPTQKQIVARKQTVWIDLVLNETPTAITDMARAKAILFQAVRQNWDTTFPKDDEGITSFIERVNCLREWLPDLDLPLIDQNVLFSVAEQLCEGARSLSEVKNGAWLDWIRSKLTSEQLNTVDREAPARIVVPSGSAIKLQYSVGKAPVLAVKIQEVFSMKSTPRVAKGRIPILLHLLSPAMRPQQITDDLESFWANGYPEVKKELRRRYPKHSWPDDPTTATPGKK
ncbi:MAG: ATP-dependent helicase HrpB [Pirellula sp.]|jgi:ATP-dependent helicase HrpB|nr:ATP-dependent helicase HrpB [Pirellula sp.]